MHKIGENIAHGLGAGANIEIGAKCAEASIDEMLNALSSYERVYLIAGLGGGTGSGASPVLAKALRKAGKRVLAFVIEPFRFEGNARHENYKLSLKRMIKSSDAVVTMVNDKLIDFVNRSTTIPDVLRRMDKAVMDAVRIVEENYSNGNSWNYELPDWMSEIDCDNQ